MKKLIFILLYLCSYVFADAQIITTIAGDSAAGYSGNGGPAIHAELKYPTDVVVDDSGNIFIADQDNYVVRKINTAGIIITVAGSDTFGFSGDGAPATNARMKEIEAIAIDKKGNLYIADVLNFRIRKVNTAGIISTLAGSDSAGYTGDGGAATAARLNTPEGLATDKEGNVYISDVIKNVVRKVDTAGIISTFAGSNSAGYTGDGGDATAATLSAPTGLITDDTGNVYISDAGNSVIRKVNFAGIINTVAGNGTAGFAGDGGAATSAEFANPHGLAIDRSGNLYIADLLNYCIRKVTTAGIITTVAGNNTGGYSGDGGPATNAELFNPAGVAVDSIGNFYIADEDNYRIRKVTIAAGR